MLEYKKVVIVTGASSGIGYQTCKLIDKNKYIVYGTINYQCVGSNTFTHFKHNLWYNKNEIYGIKKQHKVR